VRTSQLNNCDYCVASHSYVAQRFGWTEEQLADLGNFRTRPDFNPREKMALELAERESLESQNVDDDFFTRLREHFDEGEVIELAATIGLFNYFTRFNNVLRLDPTK
jgi:alkylhydroperoxidase family enzyme